MTNKGIIFSFLLLLCYVGLTAQSELGLKFGISSYNVDMLEKLELTDIDDIEEMSIEEVDFGFHAGIYGRIKILSFFIEPSVLFNSNSASYNITSDSLGVNVSNIKKEYYQNIDIPLMLGFKVSIVNIHAGPVAHIHLNSTSELFDISGYDQKFSEASFGYQGGIGLNLKKLRLEVNYEGNLDKFGNHMSIDDSDISFSKAPSRIVGTVGIAF